MATQWIPLEANADIFTDYARDMCPGLPAAAAFHDLYSLDPADQCFGAPVQAVVFLYPLSLHELQSHAAADAVADNYFVRQTIDNACGTVALLHVLGSLDLLPQPTRPLAAWAEAHRRFAQTNLDLSDRSAPASGDPEDVDLHYCVFVARHDTHRLVMLDGRLAGPVDCGPLLAPAAGCTALLHTALTFIRTRFCLERSNEYAAMVFVLPDRP